MIQRGRGYVCVDWSQEEYEPLVSHGWGKMECVSNKVLPKGKYWSSCSGTQDVFLGIFWAILINHGQEIWIQTWMSSQDHPRNRTPCTSGDVNSWVTQCLKKSLWQLFTWRKIFFILNCFTNGCAYTYFFLRKQQNLFLIITWRLWSCTVTFLFFV